ncbi:RNA polymerase I specific transcription initiation factor RRN7 [Rhodovulum bhavnagarense]|uniref:RNA polymerase I specific transcription initiation factor RRN7 n=1 Tax=Rhodovulum bhavnagarense TaxID=992286 RepID=A0A4R2REN3_9RHOB|nr:TFIIB-type zinc finger domain-containing protein [Rhodovulum bhavnagarense]TCP60858.1 RNA polymerase I specific transcription initiation factor RRN7 [Rhodovulum bhavnagarense]
MPRSSRSEHRFPCDQCGADFRFSPSEGRLVCDHCGQSAKIDDDGPGPDGIAENDFLAALNAKTPQAEAENIDRLKCPNCGAELELDLGAHAGECPFCATPMVTDTGPQRLIKPRAVIPFALEEREAQKAMTDWLGGLWFAPNGLRNHARKGRRMQGVYVPYWTFDADTQSRYSGARGMVVRENNRVPRNGQPRTVRAQKIRWTPVSGHVARFFDDILVLAATSLPKSYTDALEPWNLSALRPYHPEYLAGFRAEGYTMDLSEGYDEARARMDRAIRHDVRLDIGGDRQRIETLDTQVRGVTFKHVLLPVWTAAYKYRGKTYRFVVNGQTGRVRGERPWSAWKIALAVLLAAGLGYLAAFWQG